jgi:hypothetical protein
MNVHLKVVIVTCLFNYTLGHVGNSDRTACKRGKQLMCLAGSTGFTGSTGGTGLTGGTGDLAFGWGLLEIIMGETPAWSFLDGSHEIH